MKFLKISRTKIYSFHSKNDKKLYLKEGFFIVYLAVIQPDLNTNIVKQEIRYKRKFAFYERLEQKRLSFN